MCAIFEKHRYINQTRFVQYRPDVRLHYGTHIREVFIIIFIFEQMSNVCYVKNLWLLNTYDSGANFIQVSITSLNEFP